MHFDLMGHSGGDLVYDISVLPDDARLPVTVEEFPDYVKRMHKNTDHLFSEEYEVWQSSSYSLVLLTESTATTWQSYSLVLLTGSIAARGTT